jgi:hypothetical protein
MITASALRWPEEPPQSPQDGARALSGADVAARRRTAFGANSTPATAGVWTRAEADTWTRDEAELRAVGARMAERERRLAWGRKAEAYIRKWAELGGGGAIELIAELDAP